MTDIKYNVYSYCIFFQTDCCSHCKRENDKCIKKKKVLKHLLSEKLNASLLRKTKTVPNTYGLYSITSNDAGEVLYIGFSKRSVRKRLLVSCKKIRLKQNFLKIL